LPTLFSTKAFIAVSVASAILLPERKSLLSIVPVLSLNAFSPVYFSPKIFVTGILKCFAKAWSR